MKKLLIVIFCLSSVSFVKADTLTDRITTAFVGNAKLAAGYTTHGIVQYEFLDNFIEAGHFNGAYIGAIDLGLLGSQLPSGSINAANFSTGAKFHISPFFKKLITLNPEWQFIQNTEIDARGSYNWTLRTPTYEISIAYPFK